MKDAAGTIVFLAVLIAATIVYLAGTNALGVPTWLSSTVLIGLYAAVLGWAVKRWPS